MSYERSKVAGPGRLQTFYRSPFNQIAIIVLIMVVISILSWGGKAWLTAAVSGSSPSVKSPVSLGSQSIQQKSAPVQTTTQVETFTLDVDGFEPKQISRPAGTFVLGIDNRNRFVDASFELVREDGYKLHEIKGSKGKLRYRKIIDLPPGSYILREVNHSDWTSQITIWR